MLTTPPLILVPPVYPFGAVSVRLPAPVLVSAPAPLIGPPLNVYSPAVFETVVEPGETPAPSTFTDPTPVSPKVTLSPDANAVFGVVPSVKLASEAFQFVLLEAVQV